VRAGCAAYENGCYVLCDLDQVPIFIGQSIGIRGRARPHLTAARSDIIANQQIDVWEIAWVWAYPVKNRTDTSVIESALFHKFHPQSALMNGRVPKKPARGIKVPAPSQKVQVMADAEIEEKRDSGLRLQPARRPISGSERFKRHRGLDPGAFQRVQRYHRRLLGLAIEVEDDTGED
jgi:hypothetical protein